MLLSGLRCVRRYGDVIKKQPLGQISSELVERAENVAKAFVLKDNVPDKVKAHLKTEINNLPKEDRLQLSAHMEDVMVDTIEERLRELAPKHTTKFALRPDMRHTAAMIMKIATCEQLQHDPKCGRFLWTWLEAKKKVLRFRVRVAYVLTSQYFWLHLLFFVVFVYLYFMVLYTYCMRWSSWGYHHLYISDQVQWGDGVMDYSKHRGRKLTRLEKAYDKQHNVLLAEMTPGSDLIELVSDAFDIPDQRVHPYDDHLLHYLSDVDRQTMKEQNRLGGDPAPYTAYLNDVGLS